MKALAVSTLAIFAIMLGGCAGIQSGLSGAPPEGQSPEIKIATSSDDLVYVVNYASAVFLSYPQGKLVGTLSGIGHPRNVCSDASGNVWFTSSVGKNGRRYRLYEFAHGGTQPISTINVPKSKSADACAVNPSNGDLAVLNSCCETGNDSVLIWPGARSGKPKEYPLYYNPTACAYDDGGNLLVTGWADSDGYFFAELKNGATKFTNISTQRHSFIVGSVEWDGRYFAVAVQHGHGSIIERLRILGTSAKLVESVHLRPLSYQTWFALRDRALVATERSREEKLLGVWKYPAGGVPLKSFPGLTRPLGLTISAGP